MLTCQNARVRIAEEGGLTTAKYWLSWRESCKPGKREVGAACPAVQGEGLMAGRRVESGCNPHRICRVVTSQRGNSTEIT